MSQHDKYRIGTIAYVVLLGCFANLVEAKPERPDPNPNPKPHVVPQLAMESNWGTVTQTGRTISIDGHDQWTAKGTIRADGSLLIFWMFTVDSRIAPGVYHVLPNGDIGGLWGYGCTLEPDGTLVGPTSGDRIYKVTPPGPVIQ